MLVEQQGVKDAFKQQLQKIEEKKSAMQGKQKIAIGAGNPTAKINNIGADSAGLLNTSFLMGSEEMAYLNTKKILE